MKKIIPLIVFSLLISDIECRRDSRTYSDEYDEDLYEDEGYREDEYEDEGEVVDEDEEEDNENYDYVFEEEPDPLVPGGALDQLIDHAANGYIKTGKKVAGWFTSWFKKKEKEEPSIPAVTPKKTVKKKRAKVKKQKDAAAVTVIPVPVIESDSSHSGATLSSKKRQQKNKNTTVSKKTTDKNVVKSNPSKKSETYETTRFIGPVTPVQETLSNQMLSNQKKFIVPIVSEYRSRKKRV